MTLGHDKEQPMDHLNRITQNPGVMGGKACIRGMRVTVGMIVGQIGAKQSIEQLLASISWKSDS
jgi:uncharacterized protein (DUF433 family)